ncbi:MAG: hypothetical protein ACI9U2_004278 [Bradymonadia bacterium]|jgi:hypothetical protein
MGVFRGGVRIAFNDDAGDVCAALTVQVQAGERLRVEVNGFQGIAVPAFSIVASGDDGVVPPAGGDARLFFSEYVEGSGNNKAVEIYNAGAAANLDGCAVDRCSNGGEDAVRIALVAAPVPAGGTFVLCSAAAASPACAQRSGNLTFNGDDALVLTCDGVILDVFGRIGEDPGDAWGRGEFTTNNHTLRRKCRIDQGDANGRDAFDPSIEWDSFRIDTFNGLGERGCPLSAPRSGAPIAADPAYRSESRSVHAWLMFECSCSHQHTTVAADLLGQIANDPHISP